MAFPPDSNNTRVFKMKDQGVADVIESLSELASDPTVPRNIKLKLSAVIGNLRENCELNLRVNKALNELDDVSSDVNLQAHTRTQLLYIASQLESL